MASNMKRQGRRALKKPTNPRNWLIELREEKGWTQADVAHKVQVTPQHYAKIESGVRKGSGTVLFRVSELFHVPLERFYAEAFTPDNEVAAHD